ncbi:MAG: hypothetical protein CL823_04765 [Crocinitomicaceae bacterium]|nr:hypothetical protein [Crocinitomicaceae bacterium]
MKSWGVFFLLALNSLQLSAQTPCPQPQDLSSKALKLFEKSTESRKKITTEDRVKYLREAVEIQEDYSSAYSELSKQLFRLSKKNTEHITECRQATNKWMELCADHNAEAYYRLGALAYMEAEIQEAFDQFSIFLTKTKTDVKPSISRKRDEVESLIPQLQFELEFYANKGKYNPAPLPLTSLTNDEYLPALSPDGSILFFTRAKRIKARGDVISKRVEELVWAKRSGSNIPFDEGVSLEYPFNEGDNYGGVSLSIDNRILIIAATNPHPKNKQNIDLFYTTYNVDGKDEKGDFFYYWEDLELLGPEINTVLGWESQPALSSDGMELFFASARATSTADSNGNPTMDIYVSRKDDLGNWGEAEMLPHPISTDAGEKAPFLHPDGKTLYFSSNRKPSGGGYDLYVTRRDTSGNWSRPINMGTPLNTSGDEHGLVVSASGNEAYFASRRSGTKGLDIMKFPLPEELRPDAVKVIHGVVDPTPPDENVRITLNYVKSKEAKEIELNRDDGSFAAIINTSIADDVLLKVEGKNVAFEAMVVHQAGEVPTGDPQPEIKLRAHKDSDESAFELRDVQFATNSTEMSSAAKIVLVAFAEYLIDNPRFDVDIEGHTDDVGPAEKNLDLSNRRARVVADYLIAKGVDSERIHAKGFGQQRPKSDNSTAEGRAINRRTEFTVKK